MKHIKEFLLSLLFTRFQKIIHKKHIENQNVDFLFNKEELSDWFDIYHSDYFIKVEKDDQIKEIYSYYSGYAYIPINKDLRKIQNCNTFHDWIPILQNYMNNYFKLPNDILVIRYVSTYFFNTYYLKGEKLLKNKIINDLGFSSSSCVIDFRKENRYNYSLNNKTVFFIKVSKNTPCVYIHPDMINTDREEYELLLINNLSFRIIDKVSFINSNFLYLETYDI